MRQKTRKRAGIIIAAKMVLLPLRRFSASARSLAQINMIPDSDGTLRWEMLAVKNHDDYYAPIGLQAARIYRGLGNTDLALDYAGAVDLGDTMIPVDRYGRMLINYRGPAGTFRPYSVSDILDRATPQVR